MNQQHDWYTTFFTGLALEFWDKALPMEITLKEIGFILSKAGIDKEARILDIPCGSGRVAIPLAKEGYRVTGIDLSAENINTLNRNARASGVTVETICADFLDFRPAGPFNLALCLGNSFCFFPIEKLKLLVRNVFQSLVEEGLFVINTGTLAESILPNLKDSLEYDLGEIQFKVKNSYLAEDSVLKSEMTIMKGDRKEEKTAYHFVYTYAEVTKMLLNSGFHSVEAFGGLAGEKYKFRDPQAYIFAGKK